MGKARRDTGWNEERPTGRPQPDSRPVLGSDFADPERPISSKAGPNRRREDRPRIATTEAVFNEDRQLTGEGRVCPERQKKRVLRSRRPLWKTAPPGGAASGCWSSRPCPPPRCSRFPILRLWRASTGGVRPLKSPSRPQTRMRVKLDSMPTQRGGAVIGRDRGLLAKWEPRA